MKCKTVADIYKAWANVLEMCEGTKVNPNDCYKCFGYIVGKRPAFDSLPENYDFAIGIVEDKPVFIGDTLYDGTGEKFVANDNDFYGFKYRYNNSLFSCNPPKPKTVMVELTVEDAECLITKEICPPWHRRISEACRKALEGME